MNHAGEVAQDDPCSWTIAWLARHRADRISREAQPQGGSGARSDVGARGKRLVAGAGQDHGAEAHVSGHDKRALAERRVEEMTREVQARLAASRVADGTLDSLLQSFVLAMLEAHELAPDLHRAVFSETPHPPELHACVLRMEESLAHSLEELLRRSPEVRLRDSDTAAHLVVQTVEALTHRFVHHGIHDLERDAFVLEVVSLLRGYLRFGLGE